MENGQWVYFNLSPRLFSKDNVCDMELDAASALIEVHVRIRILHGPGGKKKKKKGEGVLRAQTTFDRAGGGQWKSTQRFPSRSIHKLNDKIFR